VKMLGEIASISSGGTPDRLNPSYWNGDIPWVTTTQINFNLIAEANEFITREGLESSAARVYKPGTLLMAMYGQGKTRGKIAVLAINAAINQACAAIKPDKDISSKYIFFNLSVRYEEIRSLSNIGNQENLNAAIIKSILIPLPKEDEEQRAIATALSDVDALITSLDKLIAKKRGIKQATMQQLLTGRTRLPGFGGEWEVKRLEERCEFYSGGTPSTSNQAFYGGNISWITSSDLNKGRIKEVEGRITQLGIEKSTAKMVKKGTLLLALYGATAGVAAITEVDAAINQAVLAIVPQKDNSEFLFQKLTLLKDWLIKTYTQGGQPNLSGQIVKLVEFSLPPLPEQQAIATVLSDMDAEIVTLERKREKVRALKQGMMQELLTGKTRLV